MRVISLFDGISCARIALDKANKKVDTYLASEIDKYTIEISKKNYPDIIHIGDIKNINIKGDIDLLIGGSPCQDLSIAGKRKGLQGERSGLFYEYLRILNEVKPKYFILENVASMSKEARDTITQELFGIEPVMINAALVSAQNRKRLFWMGKLDEFGTYKKVEIPQPDDKEIYLRDILEKKVDDSFYVKPKSNTIRSSGRGSGLGDKHNWDTIRIGQIGKGGQGDRIYSTEGKSTSLSALGGGRGAKTGLYEIESEIRKLTPLECERLQCVPDNYTEYGMVDLHFVKDYGNIEIWKNVLSQIAKEKKELISVPVYSIIKDIKDMESLNSLLGKLKDVNIVIDKQSLENSATSIIKIGIGTKTHYTQIKLENIIETQLKINQDILEIIMESGDTETLWKNILGENWVEMKLSIISILINLIIELKIYMFAHEKSICIFTTTLKKLLENLSKKDISLSKMENINQISNTQRYKMLGNAFNVDVIVHILKNVFPQVEEDKKINY